MTTQLDNELTDKDFTLVVKLIQERVGIRLSERKRSMVKGRLARRARELGDPSISAYLERVRRGDAAEQHEFVNCITTNLTSFFREPHHFDDLSAVVSELRSARRHRIRIWSSACSTGQEPYSIALTLEQAIQGETWDAKVLATDVDSNVLETARRGYYPNKHLAELSKRHLERFEPSADGLGRTASNGLKQLLRFRQLNLLENWPMQGPFDVIFCRNVLIYFDEQLQRQLVDRFIGYLRPGGRLLLGHSESLCGAHPQLVSLGKTAFRRK